MKVRSLPPSAARGLLILGVAVAYYAAARLGLLLAFEKTNASPVWPPSGIAFAAVLLLRYRAWPGIALGAFCANVAIFLTNQAAGSLSIGVVSIFIAVGNTLEAVSGAYLLRRLVGSLHLLDRVQDVFKFLAVALLMCAVSSAVGTTSLCLAGVAPWAICGTIWLTWWLGDVAGVLILTPMLLAWWQQPRIHWKPRWLAETALLFLALFGFDLIIFGAWFPTSGILSGAYMLFLFLLWAVFRFGQREATTAVAVVSGFAIWETIHGFGPFVGASLNGSLLSLQAFVCVTALSMMSLSAALAERRRAEEELQTVNRTLEQKASDLSELNRTLDQKVADRTLELEHSRLAALNMMADVDEARKGLEQANTDLRKEITERKQVEEALRQSGERTRLIIETSQDAFIAMDIRGLITNWNAQAEATFGWPRQEVLGRPLADTIIPPQHREAHRRGLAHFLATGEGPVLNRRIEITALHRDGREFPVELTISPLRFGEIYIFNAFVHDITERKRAEEELQRAKEAAEAANRAKSEFLANMSHEIRTPMNGIIGMTELALDTQLTPEQREYLEMVRTSADSLLNVINDILDFSKIEAGKLDIETVDFNLRDCLDSTMDPLALRAHQKGLELICHARPDVPDALVGDPGRLRQVLVNLVGNAIKFTERGEVVVEVEKQGSGVRGQESGKARSTDQVEGERDGLDPRSPIPDTCFLHFSIRDTGIGIPPDKQEVIFHAFEQADGSSTRRYGGTGLGLAISSQLVEMMGGRIWVESQVGVGSAFHLTVQFGLQQEPAAGSVPAEPVDLRDLPVLIVDDNATNRRILEELLAHWRMRPTTVESGRTALAALEQARSVGAPFALVLLDGHLPEMDGFAVAERIKQAPGLAGIAIIMLTSAGQRGDAARCRELGIEAYLTKPVKHSELLDTVLMTLSARPRDAEPHPLVTRHALRESQRRLRILLAEDNAVNQRLAVRLLEKQGHTVVVAANGREALESLEGQAFDLALMDVQMPEMDGFEATERIRERERATGAHIPIIAMTAYAMKGDRERCLAAGMDGYVSKPIRAEELFQAIEELVPPDGRAGESASPEQFSEEVFDRAEALDRLEDDEGLLKEIAALFLDSCPEYLSRIQQAVLRRDNRALERAAHALKGSVGNLSARVVFEAAWKLEEMGERGDLTGAQEAYAALEQEVERLKSALAALGKEGGA